MPEFHFFSSLEDEIDLVQWILNEYDCEFYLDATLRKSPLKISKPVELLKIIQEQKWGPRFFITSMQWSEYPIKYSMTKSKFDGKSRCYVSQRYGGPAFDLIFGNLLNEEKIITASSLSYYPFYYKFNNSETMKPNVNMINAFKSIKKYLNKNGKKIGNNSSFHNPSSIILHNANKMMKNGWRIN